MPSVMALLLAESNSVPLPAWMEALKEHPIVVVISIAIAALVAVVTFGDALSGFLSLFGIENPFQRRAPASDDPQVIRRQLLKIVKKEVNRRLATSLHNLVKLDFYMEDQRQKVGNPKFELVPEDSEPSFQAVNRVLHSKGDRPPLDLKFTQKIIEVFERQDIAGKLLILGEPGSGKTTELLQLAKDLVARVEEDDPHPVPVILELSSWDGESIDKWVASQLDKLYSVSEATTQQWLESNQILLILDGLDELGLEKQRKCIEQINQFLETTRTSELVVCCRREEYEVGQIELDKLNGAIYLEALKEDQIRQYFEELNRLRIWENVRGNPALLELAQKPLFLFMLVVAYQNKPIRNEQELFDTYIEKQLHDPKNQGTYKPGEKPTLQQTIHYLTWLAKQLESINETEFLIEGLQPSWLSSTNQTELYRVVIGLSAGLPSGLMGGLIGGSFFGLVGWLISGVLSGLSIGLNAGLSALMIEPKEKIQWSFRSALNGGLFFGLNAGLFFGLMGGLFFGLDGGLINGLMGGLFFGLFFGLNVGLIGLLMGGLNNVSITEKETPNQGIIQSIQNIFRIGLMTGLFFGLMTGLIGGLKSGLIGGLKSGLSFGLMYGLIGLLIGGLRVDPRVGLHGELPTAIQHFILRIFLTINGHAPWNYARFLEHAVKHRFIQRTGGRYRFVHDLLRKHFAAMPLE